jgi:hypothetical protein
MAEANKGVSFIRNKTGLPGLKFSLKSSGVFSDTSLFKFNSLS